jgi:hypothetical protein
MKNSKSRTVYTDLEAVPHLKFHDTIILHTIINRNEL